MSMSKVFNDSVHGHIELHPILVKIIDTPQFQRLREIKQLGPVYYVYPGASHNRFEHSIGVCYLAGKLITKIKDNQPELYITDVDVLCVKIAGLCHDLGHGVYSHFFEQFIHEIEPSQTITHEEISTLMFEHLINANNLMEDLRGYGIGFFDIVFIKEQIHAYEKEREPQKMCQWACPKRLCGRPDKMFLYEIVANKRNGVDVDKWDYMLRDCQQLGMKCSIDVSRFIQYARVIGVDDELQICLRDKQANDVYIMMQTRKMIHDRACRHRVANIITAMLIDALKEANDHLFLKGKSLGPEKQRKEYKMTKAYQDMEAYAQLTDSNIFSRILYSEDSNLTNSKTLIERVRRRELYRFINSAINPEPSKRQYNENDRDTVRSEILTCYSGDKEYSRVSSTDIVVTIVNSHYGMGKKDPVQDMRFYPKNDKNRGRRIRKEEISATIAGCFFDQRVEIYSRSDEEEKIDSLKHLFHLWCKKTHFIPKIQENGNSMDV